MALEPENAERRRRLRRLERMRLRARDAIPEPCPILDLTGTRCALDKRKHYHVAWPTRFDTEVVRHGTARDREIRAQQEKARLAGGLVGRDAFMELYR
jgi:hypothetical protein